jgi:DNA-binding MarR family transcriptional regulator
MTETPILTGQDIGQAHLATRAVLERLLAQTGLDFGASVTLNAAAGNDPPLRRADLIARVVHGLKIEESAAVAVLTDLLDQGLVALTPPTAADPEVTLTPAGQARFQQVREGIGQITQRLYGGLPNDDLAAAHRVLTAVTDRANAELELA